MSSLYISAYFYDKKAFIYWLENNNEPSIFMHVDRHKSSFPIPHPFARQTAFCGSRLSVPEIRFALQAVILIKTIFVQLASFLKHFSIDPHASLLWF